MKYDWALWKAKVTDDSVRFVHVDDLPASGFASVYCFAEADAKSIGTLGTYRCFKGTVHCPLLKIDCDTEEASASTERRLVEAGIAYRKYSTGNRGHHYHIERTVLPSHMLPALDKAYVTEHFPGTDTSFYHHVGWYRQEGAVHGKTGEAKTLLADVQGTVLDMSNLDVPFSAPGVVSASAEGGIKSIFGDSYLNILTVPYSGGERHNAYCKIAVRLDELNQPLEWAFVYLANVNLMSVEPLADEELKRILDWAYFSRNK